MKYPTFFMDKSLLNCIRKFVKNLEFELSMPLSGNFFPWVVIKNQKLKVLYCIDHLLFKYTWNKFNLVHVTICFGCNSLQEFFKWCLLLRKLLFFWANKGTFWHLVVLLIFYKALRLRNTWVPNDFKSLTIAF